MSKYMEKNYLRKNYGLWMNEIKYFSICGKLIKVNTYFTDLLLIDFYLYIHFMNLTNSMAVYIYI